MPGTSADQEVGHVRTPTLEHLTVANSKTRNQTVTLDHYTRPFTLWQLFEMAKGTNSEALCWPVG
jgi:hypothetical protein